MQDLATERALLCGLVQNGKEAYVDIQDVIGPNSFTETQNAIIFSCLATMYEGSYSYDLPSFLSAAGSLGHSEAMKEPKQLEYLKSLTQMKVGLDNVRKHAVKLSKIAVINQLQEASRQTYRDLSNLNGNESLEHILAEAEKSIFGVTMDMQTQDGNGVEFLGEGILDYVQWLRDNKCDFIGVPSPYATWNTVTGGGFRRGKVSLFGARPKVGKTTVGKDIGLYVSDKGIPVLYLDTEMDSKDLKNKVLSCLTDIPTKEIETGQFDNVEWKVNKVIAAGEYFSNSKFAYRNIAGYAFDDIMSIVRRWIFQHVGFDENGNTNDCLIIYDYFKLQEADKLKEMQETQALGFQVADMTNFAIQYDVPFAAFVQLNRSAEDIAQSDRLLWLCASFTKISRKTNEEILEDGPSNGNIKFTPLEARFGPAMRDDDYINIHVNYETSSVRELGPKSSIEREYEDGKIGDEEDEDFED